MKKSQQVQIGNSNANSKVVSVSGSHATGLIGQLVDGWLTGHRVYPELSEAVDNIKQAFFHYIRKEKTFFNFFNFVS